MRNRLKPAGGRFISASRRRKAVAKAEPLEGEYIPRPKNVIDLGRPHSGQLSILRESWKHKRNIICCGRRYGKTELIKLLATDCALKSHTTINGLGEQFTDPGKVGIFTPTRSQWITIYNALIVQLGPAIKSASKTERMITLKNGGTIRFWSTLHNELAGRGDKYHLVLMDEAAFGDEHLIKIFKEAITPTLMDYDGTVYVCSTPNGIDPKNFFYKAWTDKSLAFTGRFRAPTSSNPLLPANAVADFRLTMDDLTFQQEVEAQFIDNSSRNYLPAFYWLETQGSGDAVTRRPWKAPEWITDVIVVADTSGKGGEGHDGHAFIFVGRQVLSEDNVIMWILGYEISELSSHVLEEHLISVFDRAVDLARRYKATDGVMGMFMEDKGIGQHIIQRSIYQTIELGRHQGKSYAVVYPINSKLTAAGKDGRAIFVRSFHQSGKVRIVEEAHQQRDLYKGEECNHLIRQVGTFKLYDPDAKTRQDDLFDAYAYAVLICLDPQGEI